MILVNNATNLDLLTVEEGDGSFKAPTFQETEAETPPGNGPR